MRGFELDLYDCSELSRCYIDTISTNKAPTGGTELIVPANEHRGELKIRITSYWLGPQGSGPQVRYTTIVEKM